MNPKWTKVLVVVVVAILAVAGLGAYLVLRTKSSNCTLQSTNPLIVDQAEVVATADPQWAATTPGWGLVQQVYQTLIMYNGTSLTNFTGVLAKNWTRSADGFHWNFTLRPGIHFSDGSPVNAFVMWYSLYRELAMSGINQYLLSENFWYPGVGYYANASNVTAALATLTTDLNSFNFATPSASQAAVMEAGNQSFRVLDNRTFQLNLGFGYNGLVPYTFLLAEISTPGAAAIDPAAVDAHGGVGQQPNSWMATHALGTGPYVLSSFDPTAGYSLAPDPGYWGGSTAANEPWNNNLQPAKVSIQVNYQSDPAVTAQDLKSGAVASASFAYIGPSTINQLKGNACVTVQALSLPFSGAGGSWWVFMNQSVYPFDNLSVRAAIVHAINYPELLSKAFGGYATTWVGPTPPGHPYYNPSNVLPYQFNLTLAQQEIANSPCKNDACAGMAFNYEYLSTSNDWTDSATLIQSYLKAIGITINPVGVTLDQFYTEQTIDPATHRCISNETSGGIGPFYIGQDFYSSDYMSPDDWTQQDFLSYGSANVCNSGFNSVTSGHYNASLDQLVLTAAGESNSTNLSREYAQMTQIMYDNYTNAWFAVPQLFAVYNPLLTGYYQTPMGSTELSTMGWNTIYAT